MGPMWSGTHAAWTRRSRRPRASAGCGLVVALLYCMLTTGCTPPWTAIVAVFLHDGHPTITVDPCRGAHLFRVWLAEKISTPSASATSPAIGNVWIVAYTAGDPSDHPITEVRLLEIAPGWTLQSTRRDTLLTAFAVNGTYSVHADTTHASTAASVEFTLDDLRSLADGEVWAAPEPFAQPQAMKREEFRRHAAASC